MAKRGHEINLASGVMFSPAQENARTQKLRAQLLVDTIIQYCEDKGIEATHKKQPSLVHEFNFFKDGKHFGRRSTNELDINKAGHRTMAGRMLESVLGEDLFSWSDLPLQPEPRERVRRDVVGAPPETAYRERIDTAPPRTQQRPDDVLDDTSLAAPVATDFSADWTIRQLRAWASKNETPVPTTITRKGDILQWLANEHPDGS